MRDGKSVRISPGRIIWNQEAWSPLIVAGTDSSSGVQFIGVRELLVLLAMEECLPAALSASCREKERTMTSRCVAKGPPCFHGTKTDTYIYA